MNPGSHYIDKVDGTVYVCMEVSNNGGLSSYCKLSELFSDYQRLLSAVRIHRDTSGKDIQKNWGMYFCLPEGFDIPEDENGYVDMRDKEIERLHAAIRKHRDYRGDDRCWLDDEELYRALPEGYTQPVRDDSSVEFKNCKRYIASRHNPATEYVSPEREIELLRAERDELQKRLDLYL